MNARPESKSQWCMSSRLRSAGHSATRTVRHSRSAAACATARWPTRCCSPTPTSRTAAAACVSSPQLSASPLRAPLLRQFHIRTTPQHTPPPPPIAADTHSSDTPLTVPELLSNKKRRRCRRSNAQCTYACGAVCTRHLLVRQLSARAHIYSGLARRSGSAFICSIYFISLFSAHHFSPSLLRVLPHLCLFDSDLHYVRHTRVPDY